VQVADLLPDRERHELVEKMTQLVGDYAVTLSPERRHLLRR
jgi:hypothetical protein